MAVFRNSQQYGFNQCAKAGGYATFWHGMAAIPQTQPARGGSDVDQWTPCLTEVYDWPWSADAAGIPFDQSNLYGVRTRAWNLGDGNGDKDWLTAVPRTLPSGYVESRRSHVESPLIYDALGDNPLLGNFYDDADEYFLHWQLRYARGAFPSWTTIDETNEKLARWRPKNLNQLFFTNSINVINDGFYIERPTISDPCWYISYLRFHQGFRGVRIRLYTYVNDSDPTPPTSGVADIKLGYSDAPPTYPNFNGTDIYTGSLGVGTDTGPGPGYDHVYLNTLIVSASSLPAIGAEKFFCAFLGHYANGPGHIMIVDWGPRTDIPLWYFASMGNKCVTGGYPAAAAP